MLPDGRVVVTGGVDNRHTSLYDPTADGWVAGPPMNLGRGYQARMLPIISLGEERTCSDSCC